MLYFFMEISRRDFMKSVGVAVGSLGLAGGVFGGSRSDGLSHAERKEYVGNIIDNIKYETALDEAWDEAIAENELRDILKRGNYDIRVIK
jgi:hypothetical protein